MKFREAVFHALIDTMAIRRKSWDPDVYMEAVSMDGGPHHLTMFRGSTEIPSAPISAEEVLAKDWVIVK